MKLEKWRFFMHFFWPVKKKINTPVNGWKIKLLSFLYSVKLKTSTKVLIISWKSNFWDTFVCLTSNPSFNFMLSVKLCIVVDCFLGVQPIGISLSISQTWCSCFVIVFISNKMKSAGAFYFFICEIFLCL